MFKGIDPLYEEVVHIYMAVHGYNISDRMYMKMLIVGASGQWWDGIFLT